MCRFVRISVCFVALAPLWMACEASAVDTPLTTELVVNGLSRPVYVTHAPGDSDRIFIVEQPGRIKVLTLGEAAPTVFLDIDSRIGGGANDERGLLGLAFHPDYAQNGFFYVNYTNNSSNTVIARYSVSGDPDLGDVNSESILLTIAQPQSNHNGGWIDFGPDGFLYIATGDGGNANDTGTGHTPGLGNGQDKETLLGKLLRIDVDGGTPFAVPPDNPFVGVAGLDEIWAYGLRNPWRCAFDSVTGDLFIADVGQNAFEEIDFQPASSVGGENWGWRCKEGFNDFSPGTTGCDTAVLLDPIHEYTHFAGNCSISGGEVYRGCAIPDLRGTYFFADHCSHSIWSLETDGVQATVVDRTVELAPGGGLNITWISSFGRDADGEIYICALNSGEVFKIVPDGVPSMCGTIPVPTLSEWGLVVLLFLLLAVGSTVIKRRSIA